MDGGGVERVSGMSSVRSIGLSFERPVERAERTALSACFVRSQAEGVRRRLESTEEDCKCLGLSCWMLGAKRAVCLSSTFELLESLREGFRSILLLE